MSYEDDFKVLEGRLKHTFQTYIEEQRNHYLNQDTIQAAQQIAQAVIDGARMAGEISKDFTDEFEVEAYASPFDGVLNMKIKPRTLDAYEFLLANQYWIPQACLIDPLDQRQTVESTPYFRKTLDSKFSLSVLQEMVGGPIEVLSVPDREGWVLVVNEEAKLRGLPVNPTATFLLDSPGEYVAGTVLFCHKESIE